jgi:hypothetical protein
VRRSTRHARLRSSFFIRENHNKLCLGIERCESKDSSIQTCIDIRVFSNPRHILGAMARGPKPESRLKRKIEHQLFIGHIWKSSKKRLVILVTERQPRLLTLV